VCTLMDKVLKSGTFIFVYCTLDGMGRDDAEQPMHLHLHSHLRDLCFATVIDYMNEPTLPHPDASMTEPAGSAAAKMTRMEIIAREEAVAEEAWPNSNVCEALPVAKTIAISKTME
jgi:hypothetical protein